MRIKGAIFDFDGTLFDSMYIWDTAGETYLASIGVTPRPGVNEAVCALSLSQTASYFKSEYDLEMTTAEIEEGINKMVRHFYYDLVQPKPGVREFLDLLQCNGVKWPLQRQASTTMFWPRCAAAIWKSILTVYSPAPRSAAARTSRKSSEPA